MHTHIFLLVVSFSFHLTAQEIFHRSFKKMGSAFEITIVDKDRDRALSLIEGGIAEIERIERLISSWDQGSDTSRVNDHAGIAPVSVSSELIDLVSRANAISNLTNGAFDISYASVDRIWTFEGKEVTRPEESTIAASINKIGFDKIEIDTENNQLFLPQEGMKIGFGAIGKGYAADRVKTFLIEAGVKAGIVNASGDLTAWGSQPDGSPWQVALVNPLNKNKVFSWFSLNDNAVVTSGDYERFLLLDGVRYGHIINPKTGYPSLGVISCSVFAPKAELADALATALFVMGVETGIHFINQIPKVEAIMIDDNGRLFTSNNIVLDEKI